MEGPVLGRILIVSTSKRYPQELKDRAVRMVLEHRAEYPSQYAAVNAVAERLDIGIESPRLWIKRADVGAGRVPGITTAESSRIKELERENRELRRANEILKSAGVQIVGKDTTNKITLTTAQTGIGVVAGVAGAAVGAKFGATIGTLFAPGPRTLIGAAVGELLGGITGAALACGTNNVIGRSAQSNVASGRRWWEF